MHFQLFYHIYSSLLFNIQLQLFFIHSFLSSVPLIVVYLVYVKFLVHLKLFFQLLL